MVSVLWSIICIISENSCLLLGIIHAAYKSSLFINVGSLMNYHYSASSKIFIKQKYICIFILIIRFATAPIGSNYSNIKHISLLF